MRRRARASTSDDGGGGGDDDDGGRFVRRRPRAHEIARDEEEEEDFSIDDDFSSEDASMDSDDDEDDDEDEDAGANEDEHDGRVEALGRAIVDVLGRAHESEAERARLAEGHLFRLVEALEEEERATGIPLGQSVMSLYAECASGALSREEILPIVRRRWEETSAEYLESMRERLVVMPMEEMRRLFELKVTEEIASIMSIFVGSEFERSTIENYRRDGLEGARRTLTAASNSPPEIMLHPLEVAHLEYLSMFHEQIFHFNDVFDDFMDESDYETEDESMNSEELDALQNQITLSNVERGINDPWDVSPYVPWPMIEQRQLLRTRVSLNHRQGADSLCAFPSFEDLPAPVEEELPLSGIVLREETSRGTIEHTTPTSRIPMTALLVSTPSEIIGYRNGWPVGATREQFRVYSMDFDVDTRTLAVCGATPYMNNMDYNVILYRLEPDTAVKIRSRMSGGDVPPGMTSANTYKMLANSPQGDLPAWSFVELCKANIGARVAHGPPINEAYYPMQPDGFHEAEQANCIRFAHLALEERKARELRIIFSSNDGYVYVCRLDETTSSDAPTKYKLVKDFVLSDPHVEPKNCAISSPCGTMIALAGDSRKVSIMKFQKHSTTTCRACYTSTSCELADANTASMGIGGEIFELEIPTPAYLLDPGPGVIPEGAIQYLAWSSDGRYLAATSDSDCSVTVWLFSGDDKSPSHTQLKIGSRIKEFAVSDVVLIAHINGHQSPCLQVSFGIANPSMLIWAERGAKIHLFDVREAEGYFEDVIQSFGGLGSDEFKSFFESTGPQNDLDDPWHPQNGSKYQLRLARALSSSGIFAACINMRVGPDHLSRATIPQEEERWENMSRDEKLKQFSSWQSVTHTRGKYFAVQSMQTVHFDEMHEYCRLITSDFITGLSVTSGNQKSASHYKDIITYSTRESVNAFEIHASMLTDMSNFNRFPISFRDAARTFLLCAKASRKYTTDTCLANLPAELIQDIVAKMASSAYKWARLDAVTMSETFLRATMKGYAGRDIQADS